MSENNSVNCPRTPSLHAATQRLCTFSCVELGVYKYGEVTEILLREWGVTCD